jgi:hypothetical protein
VDPQRFDNVTRAWATPGSRRRVLGGLLAAAVAGLVPKRAAAQSLGDEIRDAVASAGNGGVADASANGGAVSIQNINSGGNAGNALGIGDTVGGPVTADGGDVANVTDIGVTADGGTAIADASGGDNNLAVVDVGDNVEECIEEGHACDHNPECCGGLVCCDDGHCRRENDCDECRDEGEHCDSNPECCGSLVCCDDHCRHPNDEECAGGDDGGGGGGGGGGDVTPVDPDPTGQCPDRGGNKQKLCPGLNGHKDKCCPTDTICDNTGSGAVNCRNL